MNIQQLNQITAVQQTNQTPEIENAGDRGAAFGLIFDATVRLLENTSALENEAQQAQIDYISGRSDDMLTVMLAEQRAQTAVTFTTQITSRVMDAYRQIMNMQI